MKNKINKELILQIVILIACMLVVAFQYSEGNALAQTSCSGPPTWGTPPTINAWPQGRTVSVVVFATPDSEDFRVVSDAIRKWNAPSIANCSNVTFLPAVRANGPYETNQSPPNDTIWVVRRPEGTLGTAAVMENEYRNNGTPLQNVRAAVMKIGLPTITLIEIILTM